MSFADLWERIRALKSGKALILFSGALVLLDVVRLFVLPHSYRESFTDIFEALIVAFAAVLCGFAAERSGKLARALWAMTAAYLALNAAADLHDFLVDLHFGGASVLRPLEFLGWCVYPVLALVVFFPSLEEGQLRWKWLPVIDFAQVGVALALVYFRFIYLHHLDLGGGWTQFGRGELVRNILISAGLLLRGVFEPSLRPRSIYRMLGGAFAGITCLKWFFPAVALVGRPAAFLAIAIFAAYWNDRSDDAISSKQGTTRLRWALSLSAAATLVLVLVLAHGGPPQYRWITRLAVAVSIALFLLRNSAAEHNRYATEKQLRRSESDLNRAQWVAHIGSWSFNIRANTVALSDETYRIIGLPPGSSIAPEQTMQILHPDDHRRIRHDWMAALVSGVYDEEDRVLVEGRTRWVHIQAKIEYDAERQPVAAVGTVQDITGRKQAEHSLRLFRTLMDQSNDAVEVFDPETLRFLDLNEKACQDLGYTREELLSRTVYDIDPNVTESRRTALLDCLRNSGSVVKETLHRRKDGSTFPAETSLRLVRLDRDYVVAVSRDISDRKKAEDALRESEDRYRDLVEHSEDLLCTHDLEGRLLSVNPAPARILGYEVAELLQMPMRELIPPEFRTEFDAYLARIGAKGADKGFLCVLSRSGERRIWEYNNTLRTEGVPSPVVRGMAHDVTERKRAEKALRTSEQRYRILFEKNIAGVAIASLDGEVLDCNDGWAHILGYGSAAELRGRQTRDSYFNPADREPLLGKLKEGKSFFAREMQLRRKDGSPVWVLFNCGIIVADGTSMVQATMIDITERKLAEEALRTSEEHYRILVEQASDGIGIADVQDRWIDVNSAWAGILGYSREEILRQKVGHNVVEEEKPRLAAALASLRESGTVRAEWKVRRKDGSAIPVEVIGKRLPDGRLQVIARDITERKLAQEAVEQSEHQLRSIVNAIPAEIWSGPADGSNDFVNERWRSDMGLNLQDLKGDGWEKMLHPDDRQRILRAWHESVVNGTPYEQETRHRGADGKYRWFLNRAIPLRDDNGQVVRWYGVQTNIDDLKQAEALVVLQKETLEVIALGKPLNESLTTLVRLIESQMPGLFASVVLLDEDGLHVRHGAAPSLPDAFAKAIDGAAIGPNAGSCGTAMYRKETVIVTDVVQDPLWKDYRDLAVAHGLRACWSTPILSSERKVLGSFAMYYAEPRGPSAAEMRLVEVATNLASIAIERKRAEESVRESEERFRSLYENSTIGIYRTTPDGKILLANPSLVRMLGFNSASGLFQRNLEAEGFEPGYERSEFKERLEKEGEIKGLESSWTRSDGTAMFVRESAKAIRNRDSAIVYYEGTVEDITDRKRAEEALRTSEERFRVALKDSPISVFSQDRDLRYTWVYNPHSFVQREVVGKTDDEILGADQARRLNEIKQRVLETGTALQEEVVIAHDGRKYSLDITLEPLHDAAGAVVGITGAAMDVARLRELADSLQNAKDQLVQEKAYLESEIQAELGFEKIIGHSLSLREVLRNARIVAPTDSTVLLLGETGTGKELVARAIHSLSARNNKNFIKLNCAAVPTGLLESELFGHEKGAFTGAITQKVGRLELADKGTLFLDEIGELPLELQPKLLRVLQDREFERLGGVRTLRVDVRLISATNRDLRKDIAEKKFREDLFYRLNVFPILLPPLRERRNDIPTLVRHFVNLHGSRAGKHIETIPDDTMTVLENWTWPGNVRELENVIERMVILTKGRVLAAPPLELEGPHEVSGDNLTEMEREHIIRVLEETNGVISGIDGAARRLGLKRTTLQSMLKRLGIELQDFRRGTGTFGPE